MIFFDFPLRIYLAYLKKRGCDDVRRPAGVFAGCVGIAVNALLAGLKFAAAAASGSVAVAVDAINNLSDAASATVTVIGFKLAEKPADDEHPFGHGRIEYIAGVIVSVLIIATGLSFLKESFVKIFSPGTVEPDQMTILFLSGALVFKFWLAGFFFLSGRKASSPALKAAAVDSLSDLCVTSLILASMYLGKFTSFPVDGIAGCIVAFMVIVSGINVLREIADPLIGARPRKEVVDELTRRLMGCPGILGVHDCIIHNYGPDLYFATAHAEVDGKGSLVDMHDILENAEREIAVSMPVRLILHCDPFHVDNPTALHWRRMLENTSSSIDERFKLYDFRLDESEEHGPYIRFHLLVKRSDMARKKEIIARFEASLHERDPRARLKIHFVTAYV